NEELRATLNELSSANEARDAYKTKSEKDALTGVFNKGTIEHIVTTGIKNIKEGNAPDAFFIIDLDHFKEANDTRGHQYGDEILKKFATSLCGIVRKNDVVGRFGGDEFILYLKNIPEERVREIAEHVVTAAHELDTTQRPRLSASMGVTLIHSSTELYDTVFRHADYSLYSVKQNGRDGYAIYQGKAQKDA
ncbi:MAG: GGDEF domain-containing protein, partial [Selenomonadaceae bacterium]